jgi:glycosyltransferase involved in cell wall biosynthesis
MRSKKKDLKNKIVVNLIQDLPTPHNNILIQQFVHRPEIEMNLWYANSGDSERYQWRSNLFDEHLPARIYGNRLNLKFLWYCITNIHERFILVGWMNQNTIALHLIFFILRRKFNHWTDLPNPNIINRPFLKRLIRGIAYRILRLCRCKVLGVGQPALNFFRGMKFPDGMLVNLPIFVAVDDNFFNFKLDQGEYYKKYRVPINGVLISAGSRLIYEKGYDLLIDAIAGLPKDLIDRVKLVIVGSGDQSVILKNKINSLKLECVVYLENWMEVSDFNSLIKNSDIFIQPARFDAYGGAALGMSLGVAVIGSTGSGAAIDRIEHGKNGLLYEANDTVSLAAYISKLATDASLRAKIANSGRQTAMQWHPSLGVNIIRDYTI